MVDKDKWKFRVTDMDAKPFLLNSNGERKPLDSDDDVIFEGHAAEAATELCRRAVLYEQTEGTRKLLSAFSEKQ